MAYYHFDLFGLVKFSFSDGMIVVRPLMRGPDAPMPSLHGGEFADHLTIPLEPRADGRSGDGLWVHVTWADGYNEEVGVLYPEHVKRLVAAMEQLILTRWLVVAETAHHVDAATLAAHGYRILAFERDAFAERANDVFRDRSRRYRVTEDRIEGFLSTAALQLSPEALDDDELRPLLSDQLMAVSESQPSYSLLYEREGWMGGEPGWYAHATVSDGQVDELVEAAMDALGQMAGPEFFERIRTACAKLGTPIDSQTIERLIARARSTSSEAA